MDSVSLPPELERFAADAVAAGRYEDISAVVRAALSLLQQTEAEIAGFAASLEEAQAEGQVEGFLSAEDVHQRMNAVLDEMLHTPQ